jgi:CHAT domain-containing protein/tetratricopeptide (TPR) repeat protein
MATKASSLVLVMTFVLFGLVMPPDFQKMIGQAQTTKNTETEANKLIELGHQQIDKGQYREASQSFQKALDIYQAINDREGVAFALIGLGRNHNSFGQYQKAISFYQQALEIAKETSERHVEASSLNGLGEAYDNLGQYQKAIDLHQQSFSIFKQIGDRVGEADSLNGLADVHESLGLYQKALGFYEQSLVIRKQTGDRVGEAYSLNGLGYIYDSLGQYPKSIELHEQSLVIRKQIGDLKGQGNSFYTLGSTYSSLEQYQKAIGFYEQSLEIFKKIGDLNGVVYALNGLGYANVGLEKYAEAIDLLQQSLTASKQIGDRYSEGYSLEHLGLAFSYLNQTELAILFYKQAINVHESIRKDIRQLPKEVQKSYLATIEGSYRQLADLLLKQDRIFEAQEVLDLLKVQELSDYLRTVRGNDKTEKGLSLQTPEQTIIALAIELNNLQQKARDNQLSASEQQRLSQLVQSEQNQKKQFNAFLNNSEVQKLIEELRRNEKQTIDPENLHNLRKDILAQSPNAVMLYPLVLVDRLELILITAKTPPIRRTVKLKREELNQEIIDFITGLRDVSSDDVKVPAQKFYTWLIKPFESELEQLKIDTIIYAPDSKLRYIPLSALYDGKKWLAEKYRTNSITAQSLTKFNPKPIAKPRILAGAFGGKGDVQRSGFNGLPATLIEVQKITDRFADTTTLIESAFTKSVTESKANSYSIVHLATHGHLSVGKPEESFILFGNGDKATISDIRNWTLNNVDLVVLSACQSGIGAKLGSGVEILGLGYQMQAAGARVAIASLWKVDDNGTQALMTDFYSELQKGDVTIAEALRRAQVSLIRSKEFNHPYYWSAFFAIGNGL